MRRDHRVVLGQAPLGTVLVRRHVVHGPEVPLERAELLAVLQANDVVGGQGLLDRHGGHERGRRGRLDLTLGQGLDGGVDRRDEVGKIGRAHRVVADIGGNEVGHDLDVVAARLLFRT